MRSFSHPSSSTVAIVALLASILALVACGQEIGANGAENDGIENVQVTLPPSIKMTHSYQCNDGSLITIDFMTDDVTINLRGEGTISQLKAPAPGEAFTDGRDTIAGGVATVEFMQTNKTTLTCKL